MENGGIYNNQIDEQVRKRFSEVEKDFINKINHQKSIHEAEKKVIFWRTLAIPSFGLLSIFGFWFLIALLKL